MNDQLLQTLAEQVKSHYAEMQELSFAEYLKLFLENPAAQCRGSAKYIVDAFDYFGSYPVEGPRGKLRRFALFDAGFAGHRGRVAGQEEVGQAIYQLLSNFAREGRSNRLILLYGPNGSAKSSIIRAIIQALEHYSTRPEGALYHFRWIFPSEKIARGQIGFSEAKSSGPADTQSTFAHLPGEDVDAVLECDCHDHPLLILPVEERQQLFARLEREGKLPAHFPVPESLLYGDLCAMCRQVHDALLASYQGDPWKVYRHIQVRRWRLSWRYRQGLATIEPQLQVDAVEQQLTASRSLAALPPAIAHLNLFEFRGPLVDANRGLLEFNDLLKRPVDSFKYILSACETGQVALGRSTLLLDTVFIGSTNDLMLDAFKEYPDFASFKARLELVRVPYLRRVSEEIIIYRDQLEQARIDRHLAPHALYTAALWAVLTRLRRPKLENLPAKAASLLSSLGPLEKARLYDRLELPPAAPGEAVREILARLDEIYQQEGNDYEGRTGASAREVRLLMMNAAQSPHHPCLSPLAVLEEIKALIKEKSLYAFLQLPPDGEWGNQEKILQLVKQAFLDRVEQDAAEASGLVGQAGYVELFMRYVQHVSAWLKKEKLFDPVTGDTVAPDEELMGEVERVIRPAEEKPEQFRRQLIARIGAYALESGAAAAGQTPDYARIFPAYFEKLREDFFARRRQQLGRLFRALVEYIDGGNVLGEEPSRLEEVLKNLTEKQGYCKHCAKQALALLIKERFS